MANILNCAQVGKAIYNNLPPLPSNNRLGKALNQSAFDWLTLVAIAWKESKFDADAVNPPPSHATGLFQILASTADDVQDRIWPNWVSQTVPIVPDGQRLVDLRTDPIIASRAAYVIALDRIAANGNDLEAGLNAYGDGDPYATKVLAGLKLIRSLAGIPAPSTATYDAVADLFENQCGTLAPQLETAVR